MMRGATATSIKSDASVCASRAAHPTAMKRKYAGTGVYTRSAKRFKPTIGSWAGAALASRGLYGAYKAASNWYNRPSASSLGVTVQNDRKIMYRKRRRRRRGRRARRSRRFAKGVKSVIFKTLGCNQFLYNFKHSVVCAQNTQVSYAKVIGGIVGPSVSVNSNELQDIISKLRVDGQPTAFRKNERVYIRSAVCDVTVKNGSSSEACDLDVYYMYCTKNFEFPGDLTSFWQNQLGSQQLPDGSAITAAGNSSIGMTFFQAPQFCKYFRITKKIKYLLQPSQMTHFQVRKKPFSFATEEVNSSSHYKGELVVFLVFNGVWNGSNYPGITCNVSWISTYNAKLITNGDDRMQTAIVTVEEPPE